MLFVTVRESIQTKNVVVRNKLWPVFLKKKVFNENFYNYSERKFNQDFMYKKKICSYIFSAQNLTKHSNLVSS